MKLKHIAAVFCMSAFALPALAQTTSTPRIDQRQANQQSAPAVEDGLFLVPRVIE